MSKAKHNRCELADDLLGFISFNPTYEFYVEGKEEGLWKFWSVDGNEEQTITYKNGEEDVQSGS